MMKLKKKQEDIRKHDKPVDFDLTASVEDPNELLDPGQETDKDENS